MSILKELFNNDIRPSGKFIKSGGPYQTLISQFNDLLEAAPADQKAQIEKITDILSDVNHIENEEHFIDGFRMGAMIMWEVVHYKSENFE